MIRKIDELLLKKTQALSNRSKIPCIIRGENFLRLKRNLNFQKIQIKEEYPFIKSCLINAEKNQILNLSKVACVEFISSISTAQSLTYLSKKILKCEKTKLTGKNVGCCVIDTGISPHLDFFVGRKTLCEFKDFVHGRKNPYDDNGHGTFVSGVLCGNGAESVGKFSGIAPDVNLFSLKVLDENGEAFSNKILDAMSWVYDNHKKKNIKVGCMSFGSEPLGYADPIMQGADALWREGVIVVSAGGNSGPEFQTIKSPGISPKILTVGGLDDKRVGEKFVDESKFETANFSSRGPAFRFSKPDVIAPSVNIKSCARFSGYTLSSGTSVATPMIAGLVCLMCEKNPKITPNQAKKIIQQISFPLTNNRNIDGFGIPDFSKIID